MKTFLNFVLFALMLTSASFTKLKTSPSIRSHFVVGHIYQPLKHNITSIPVQPPAELFIVRGFIKNMVTNKLMEDNVLKTIKAQVIFQNLVTKEKYNAEILAGAIYTVKLPPGQYIRQSSGVKYAVMDDKINIRGNSNENVANNIVFLSKEINGYRAILTWGKVPLDLDAHVVLPDGNEVHFDQVSKDFNVTLNVDNRLGYGPEVVSFEDIGPGVYKYYVNRFSNEAALSDSQAVVRLLKGARLYGTYLVPLGGYPDTDNWHVFNIDQTNGTVEVINELKDLRQKI